jgi:NAD+ synthase (glutamine-hydrolysing)
MLSLRVRFRDQPRSDRTRIPVPDSSDLRICVAQIRPRKGAVSENLERIQAVIQAHAGRLDLLIFAETVTSGYFVEGGVAEVARTSEALAAALGSPPEEAPDVILGAYEQGRGGTLYNSAIHFTPDGAGWRVVHVHRKVFLPTYGLFDESRFVQAGTRFESYSTRFGRMGMLICEEVLHSLPPTILALDGAEILVGLSASPAREFRPGPQRPGSLERWDVASRAVALEHGMHLVLAHLVGSEGGRIFPGGSALYGPGGEVLQRASLFEEDRLEAIVSLDQSRRARRHAPLLEDLRLLYPHVRRELDRAASGSPGASLSGIPPAPSSPRRPRTEAIPGEPHPQDRTPLALDLPLVEEALISFLRDEIQGRRGFQQVVVGVSGGVDSAVSAALAVRALGRENVHPFLLPYATSSPESLSHGMEVCDSLGLSPRTISITPSVDAYIQGEEPGLSPLRRGNLASRFRGMVLFDQAARRGALPLGTGNKSERLLGYFTWHGDDAPPINPLGDLFKTQVWALAQHLGVPDSVVRKPPSADLVEGVHDEDELGVDYPTADLILYWLLEGVSPGDLLEAGFNPQALDRVWQRLQSTHWKRRPPTSALLSGSGIGDSYLRPVDF